MVTESELIKAYNDSTAKAGAGAGTAPAGHTGQAVYHSLADLVGLYVEVVTDG